MGMHIFYFSNANHTDDIRYSLIVKDIYENHQEDIQIYVIDFIKAIVNSS